MLIEKDKQAHDAAFVLVLFFFLSDNRGVQEPAVQSWVSLHN